MFSKLFLLAPLASLVLASPMPTDLETRATIDTSSHCGQWDTVTAGQYEMFLDLWGESGATSGSQCSNLVSLSGSTISWKTTWTWTGGTGVKSFSNIQLNTGVNQQLSAISSMPVSQKISLRRALAHLHYFAVSLAMVTEQLWDDCCRRRVRPLHVEHGGRLEHERDHDLARELQRRPHLLHLRL